MHRARLGGTLQNDILKEYQAQKEFVFPPRPVDAAGPRHRSPSPPPRCPAGTRSRSPATTSARPARRRPRSWRSRWPTASPTSSWRCRPACRSTRSPRGSASSSTPTSTSSRRSPSTGRRAASGPAGCRSATAPQLERSLQLRFHTQTAGRVAHRPAARGQHRAHRHRGAGRRARRHAVPAHQLDGRGAGAAHREGGPHRPAHPAGASPTRPTSPTSPIRSAARWFVEALTDEMERQAEEIFAHLDELGDGSMLEGVITRHRGELVPGPHRRLGLRARAQVQRRPPHRRRRQPFTEGNDDDQIDLLQITNEDEARQLKRLDQVRHDRDADAVDAALARLAADAADPERQPDAGADRRRRAPTPRSARSWARWPVCSAATSRSPRSERVQQAVRRNSRHDEQSGRVVDPRR